MKNEKRWSAERLLKSPKWLWIIALICVFGMVLFEACFQIYTNVTIASRTTESLIEQVKAIIAKNESADSTLESALKEEYIVRAKAASYILERNPELEKNIDELLKIAKLIEVDEIHLFNKKGVIYNGTVPKYYGIGVDAGGQIGFFKELLYDTSKSFCQNMMPNTAEGKEMMYAMVWRENLTGLVEVGIEPTRLLEELKNHKISEVVSSFPVVKGEGILIIDRHTGMVSGSTEKELIGKTISEIGIKKDKLYGKTHIEKINGKYVMSSSIHFGKYDIVASLGLKEANQGLPRALLILLLYLSIAVFVVVEIVKKLNKIYAEKKRDYDVLLSMSRMYNSVHLVDLEKNECSEYTSNDIIRECLTRAKGAINQMRLTMSETILPEYHERILEFTNLETLPERMCGKKAMYCDVVGRNLGWTRVSFMMLEADENGRPKKVVYTTHDIDEQKKEEEKLLLTSNTDALTNLFNRRAFERDIEKYKANGFAGDFAMVSMDLNELKRINDSIGHAAGDELIVAAANCMRVHFSPYGKVYRMGGDEFFILLELQESKIKELLDAFENKANSWSGKLVQGISVSWGYVTSCEAFGKTYSEVEKIADERMYAAKRKYYASNGVDRRR